MPNMGRLEKIELIVFSRGQFVFQKVQGVVMLGLTVLGCSQAYLKLRTLKVRSNSGGSGCGVGI